VPGLYAWLRRNPRLVDGALALLLVFPGAGIPKLGIVRLLVTLPFVVGMAVPVVFRRAYPVEAFVAVIAVGALQVLLLRRPAGADLAVLVVLYTLAASRPRRVSLRGLIACLAGAAAAIVRWHRARGGLDVYTIGTEAALFGAPVLLAWLLGDSARWRRGYYQALEERAARLERERDAQAQVAAAAERARIAREIHDVVAHNVSVMVVQAGRGGGQMVPPRVLSALQAAPALGIVADDYFEQDPVNGVKVQVGAIGRAALGASVQPVMISGSLAAIGPGTAGVDSGQLKALGAHQGGTVSDATPGGTETFRVAAVYNSAGLAMPDVLLSTGDYQHAFAPAGANEVFVNAASGVPVATSRAAVGTATASDPLLTVSTLADYKASLSGRVDEILTLFGVLLGLAVLIALLGMSNTLSLSVLERPRESALMRALGLTRGQLRLMLLTEALLMAALAIVLGAGLGVAFGAVMVHGFVLSTGGQGMLSVPYASIALYALIGVAAALAAAVLPARRAARTSVVTAMAEA